jgi:hypothetical protein
LKAMVGKAADKSNYSEKAAFGQHRCSIC